MGKNKKNKNKNIDVVEQTGKNNEKKQQGQTLQTDPVNETTQPQTNNQQTKNSEQKTDHQEKTQAPIQNTDVTVENQQSTVTQQSGQITSRQPNKENHTIEAVIQKLQETKAEEVQKKIQQHPQTKNQQLDTKSTQIPVENQNPTQKVQKVDQVHIVEGVQGINDQNKKQQQTKHVDDRLQEQPKHEESTSNKIQQVQALVPEPQKEQPHLEQQNLEQPIQNLTQNINISQPISQPPPINQSDLFDGLKYVGMAAQQIIYHNPLQHEAEARGLPTFTQNFQPAAFHLTQRLLQQLNIGTPPKQDQNKLLNVGKDDGLQQIRRSAESIDPDPLQLEQQVQDTKKVNILSSIHSQFSQDKDIKTRNTHNQTHKHQHLKNQQSQKQESIKSEKIKKSDHIIPIVPATNPTYINPLPTPHHQQHHNKPEEVKQIDFDKINQKMLKQRQIEWKKLQQKELQPRRPTFVMVQQPQVPTYVDPVEPNRPEKLLYTNNLPVIDKERTTQQHKRIIKQENQIKEKLQQSQKLKKDATNDNPIKKLAVSALVTAACLGVCVLGKADKRVTAGVSIASLIFSYIAQR